MLGKIRFFLTFKRIFTVLLISVTLLVFISILYADYSAFTWGKFTFKDYGSYTNTIWNCGHGSFFKHLVDGVYFSTHISFTLALLGPFFWIWDHPFLLSVLQWLFLMVGALILWRTAYVHKLSSGITAAVLFFYIANPFTQAVMLCEFHGVSFYLFLIPWLYSCLLKGGKFFWIPFILLLGVREDSGFVITPMLLYFAIKDKRRLHYFLAALAVLYSVFAIHVLFPLLGGIDFFQRRGRLSDLVNFHFFTPGQLLLRVKPLLGCFLAISLFLRKRGWIPIFVFPLSALAICATSKLTPVYLLKQHYPAALIACVTVGVLEAVIRSIERGVEVKSLNRFGYALFLCAVTVAWHVHSGFLRWGGNDDRVYRVIHPRGKEILQVVQQIPKQGILLCQKELAGFCANRADLMIWEHYNPKRYRPDLVFIRFKIIGDYREQYKTMIQSGEFGVRYCDHGYAILERGYSTSRNEEILKEFFS